MSVYYASPEEMIPVRGERGKLLQSLPISQIKAEKGRYIIVPHKSGKGIKYAMLRPRMSLAPLSTDGKGFEQTLPSGRVLFALYGTTGSGKRNSLVDEEDLVAA